MNFKRPSFKRGGPTGIAQMTPSRQRYAGGGNIGGGTIAGSNLGTRTGFESIILQSSGLPYPDTKPKYTNPFKIKGYPSSKGILEALKPRGLAKYPISTGLASTAALAAIPVGLAYMNRPDTLAEKKVMQDYGMIDETFFDYDKMYADREAASKVGDKISFSDGLFMDPETGLYPKIFGRTDDRNKRAQIEKDQIEEAKDINIDMRGDPAQFTVEDELTDFDAIAETMIADKKTKTKTDEDKPEPTFEDTYQTEFDKIQKLIGDDNTKGMAAIALSEAIKTPGTLADKAAVLNKSLLGIMGNKSKNKKEIAMLAYKATKEIEKAKIVAGKQTDSAKNFEELKTLNRIIKDDTGTYNEDQKKNARSKLKVITAAIDNLNPAKAQKTLDPAKAVATIDAFNKRAKKLAKMDKNDPDYARSFEEYKAAIELLNNYPELMTSVRRIDASNIGALGKKDGGRIGFANGSPIEQITETETIETSGTPTAQVTQLSFEELRSRLPQEITDDVVKFLSTSNEALQDFAYIRTAGDVKKFNMKYGLNLVLPAQA